MLPGTAKPFATPVTPDTIPVGAELNALSNETVYVPVPDLEEVQPAVPDTKSPSDATTP